MPDSVLVIGANRGIGLELTRLLSARGDSVTAACRRSSPELDALANVTVQTDIDVRSGDSLKALAESFDEEAIDRLIVVAGILRGVSLDSFNTESVREQFEVNALGPLAAVATLRSRIKSGGKVALLTSRMGSIADNSSGGAYGYRMSKAALNMAGASLAIDLKDNGVSVVLLHPGFVRTEMTHGNGHIDPDESARGLLDRIDALTLETSGQFLHQNGEQLPW